MSKIDEVRADMVKAMKANLPSSRHSPASASGVAGTTE